MAFEHVSGIFLNYDDNIWEPQSMCYKTVRKFHISQKEMFSNWICVRLMENWHVYAAVLIWVVIVTREDVDFSKVSQNGSFRAFK